MASTPAFARVLGRADLLLFSVSAVLTIDALASAASLGVSWFAWWGIILLVFFVPYALIVAELGAAWPAEGGIFIWVREAFGPRWGFLAAWLYWINNAFWIPTVGLVFAGVLHSLFLKPLLPASLREGAGATALQTGLAILLIWITVGFGVVRLSVAKWLPNGGAIVKGAIFIGLGALGLMALLKGDPPANDFSAAQWTPRLSDSLAFLPVLLYNVLGFELMSAAGGEMRDPPRDVPRAVLRGGLIIGILYGLGVGGILLAVPLKELSVVTGTWDALAILGNSWGGAGRALVMLLGVGFLFACLANLVTWSLGVNRVIAAAAHEGAAPALLGKLHPRNQTPWAAFVLMGVIATGLLLGNACLAANANNLFWMIFKLSSLCFLLSYLLVFPAFLALRRTQPAHPRPYRLPGGPFAARAAATLAFIAVAAACVLFFLPSPGSRQPRREFLTLAGETAATLLIGALLIPRKR